MSALSPENANANVNANAVDNNYNETDEDDGVQEITGKMLGLFGAQWIMNLPRPAPPIKQQKQQNTQQQQQNKPPTNSNNNNNNSARLGEKTNLQQRIRIPSAEAIRNTTKNFERAVAKELYETNYKDREKILHEIHGVQSRAIPETPQRISVALLELETEISHWVQQSQVDSKASKLVHAHVLATETLDSQYVTTPAFRLRFLRAVFFDPKKAATRYLKCLNHLLDVFGEPSLQRPLYIDDLDVSERALLESGRLQILRSRDRMGRRIAIWFVRTMSAYNMWERQRVETYLIFGVLGEDVETQKHGAVAIMIVFGLKEGNNNNMINASDPEIRENLQHSSENATSSSTSSSSSLSSLQQQQQQANNIRIDKGWTEDERKIFTQFLGRNRYQRMRYKEREMASPIRWSSMHFCLPDERIYHFMRSVVVAMLPPHMRNLNRTHTGSYLECIYQLKQFGIPIQDIPGPSAKGVMVKTKTLARFLKCRGTMDSYRKTQQQTTTPEKDSMADSFDFACPGTDCPESNCVVFGDRMTYTYPANVAFREYLRSKEHSHSRSEQEANQGSTTSSLAFLAGNKGSLRLSTQVLDEIIDELTAAGSQANAKQESNTVDSNSNSGNSGNIQSSSHTNLSKIEEQIQEQGFRFATYDKEVGWYRYMDPIRSETDRIELRKRISQTMRDDRKRLLRSNRATSMTTQQHQEDPSRQHYVHQQMPHAARTNASSAAANSATSISSTSNLGIDASLRFPMSNTNSSAGEHMFSSCMGHNNQFDAKRFKSHHCWGA